MGRQRRLRVGDAWYRIDLLVFHRRLRCLVVIDLKLGKFTPADTGQMHLYVGSHHLSPPATHELSPPGCRGRVTRFKLLWSFSAVQLSSPV